MSKFPEISPRIYDERQLKALTGLSEKQFMLLLVTFEKILNEIQQEKYKNKARKPGSGRKAKLEKPADKLLFILYYLKCYPTFDNLGFAFSMDNSSAFNSVQAFFPVLMASLERLNVLPKTKIETAEELQQAFGNVTTLLIDATERPMNRPQDKEQQKDHHSGKKNAAV